METFTLVTLIVIGAYFVNAQQQRRRIALLGSHLGHFQIEKLMENLTEGYLRCLGEDDPERREQIWRLLDTTEEKLSGQFDSFAAEFAQVGEQEARVSKLPLALPFAQQLLPGASFDLRQAFAIHARGIAGVMRNERQRPPKAKAFMMSAELFLMQHSCHWYCKSKTVASARLLARHKTSYEQVLDAVSPETRKAYGELTGQ
ncbi:hypothetical protein [Variovorax saccharolyticus]|uniref:hypothetical protein n=1 Tax=Variovorax saccharolyticus TaxID=3053516 RepID=UPI00257501B7|nr:MULTISPECIES: hypothetical protein [unclassified Variovorax]MDM0021575.1 hypothetical protein [Variovorax sp. J22R187]MDM0028168.1 hypothetical protein [Variovorax sp. J31P216]